jgi:hypothetical protein
LTEQSALTSNFCDDFNEDDTNEYMVEQPLSVMMGSPKAKDKAKDYLPPMPRISRQD